MLNRGLRYPLALCFLALFIFHSTALLAQGSGQKLLASGEENENLDHPEARARWNMRGRTAPKGESAAALRFRAYQQKMTMRAERARAFALRNGITPALTGFAWVSLGPSPLASDATGNGSQDYDWVSGRATSVVIDPNDPTGNTVLLGGAYGGLWKSTNAGSLTSGSPDSVVWQALIDDQPTLAVGAIAVQPGNGDVILVGTGETNSSGDSYYGLGILRSTDGGSTWTQITSAATGQSFLGIGFSKIVFSTANPNLVVATTGGNLGLVRGLEDGSQAGRGVYYSTNAGATWNRVILSDNAIQASSTGLAYNAAAGAFYVAIRRHGLYSSTDGQHFTRLAAQPSPGLASGNCPSGSNSLTCLMYRAEITAVPGRNEMYVWIVDVTSSEVDRGIWRSTNGGGTWTQISSNGITHCGDSAFGVDSGCGVQQGAYNLEIAAIPNGSATDVYAGTINIYKCTLASGGTGCTQGGWLNLTHVYGCSILGAPAHVHPDQHGVALMVASGKAVGYFAHDGGISRALDGYTGLTTGSCTGTNQFDSLSQSLGSMTEFVSFSVHPASRDILLGGTQDNGSPKTSTVTSSAVWQNALSGDGGFNAINPTNPAEWFASVPNTQIGVCESGPSCNNSLFSLAVDSSHLGGDVGAFYTPYILDPQRPSQMLVGTCRVWRVATTGAGALKLSNNFDTGGTSVCTGGEQNLVNWLDAGGPKDASNNSKVVYAVTDGSGPFGAGSTGGEVWATTNSGTTLMTNVTRSINPNHYAISSVAIDRADVTGKTAYVGIMGFHTSHVWKTTNAGTSWTDWSGTGGGTIPDAPVQSLIVDSGNVYAGTDAGVFVSTTASASWSEVGPAPTSGLGGFLPNAPVTAMRIFKSGVTKLLRVSTYGRGIWEFDLAPPAPEFQAIVSNTPLVVLPNQTATFNGKLAAVGGYNSAVTLTCGAGAPGACTFSPAGPITPTTTGAAFTVSTPAGATIADYSFNLHGVGADASSITHDTPLVLHVADFTMAPLSGGNLGVQQNGTSTSSQFGLSSVGTFTGTINLSCTGLPAGASCAFSPSQSIHLSPGNPSVTVTLAVSAAATTPTGTYTVTIESAFGGDIKQSTFTLNVAPPDFTLSAVNNSATALAGRGAAYTLTVDTSPATGGAFPSTITFTCPPDMPALTACTFTPATIAAGATGPQQVQLTIATTGPNPSPASVRPARRAALWPLAIPATGLVLAGLGSRKMSRGATAIVLCLTLTAFGVMIACGGGGGNGGGVTPPPPTISVTVSGGTPASLFPNSAGWPAQTATFTATVNNSTNKAVTWSVQGGDANGTIDANGLYSSPTVSAGFPASATIIATSQADSTKHGQSTETLTPATIPGTYDNIVVTATDSGTAQLQSLTLVVQ